MWLTRCRQRAARRRVLNNEGGLLLLAGLAGVGFRDDYLKISRERNLGLHGSAKLGGQTLVAVVFAILAIRLPDAKGITPASTFVSFIRDLPGRELGVVLFVLWALFMVSASSNGVNLVDGTSYGIICHRRWWDAHPQRCAQ